MDRISTRQHLVPGFIDLAEEELSYSKKRELDPWTVFAALVFFTGIALLFWGTRA